MKTIAILAPMQEELDALVRLLPPVSRSSIHGIELLQVEHHGQNLVLMRSGVGKVNTAMNLALLLGHMPIDEVVNIGSAGGMREGHRILDLVVPDEVLAIDVDVTPLGFEFGQMLGEPSVYHPDSAMLDRFAKVAAKWPDMPMVHRGAVGTGDSFVYRPANVSERIAWPAWRWKARHSPKSATGSRSPS
jgi:adenosylhomocysteine nucleosidase